MAMKYYFPDAGETAADGREIESFNKSLRNDPLLFAEAAAEHYNSRNGWMDHWPIEMAVVMEDGSEVSFIVDRKMVPEFWAQLKK
jgi:hypothetical protein